MSEGGGVVLMFELVRRFCGWRRIWKMNIPTVLLCRFNFGREMGCESCIGLLSSHAWGVGMGE